MAATNVDRTKRGPSRRPSPAALARRSLGAVPPPALVLLDIISVQLGSALAKQLFSAVGSFGAVALRLFFAAAVLMLWWRPSLRMDRRSWTQRIAVWCVVAASAGATRGARSDG